MMKKRILSTYILIFTIYSITAIGSDYKFRSLTINDGLVHNSVRCIKKDHMGFMWFGTQGGLSRFDGYSFKNYKEDYGTPGALLSNNIFALEVDSQGDLWVGSNIGPQKMNFSRGDFDDVFIENNATGGKKVMKGFVSFIFEDKAKTLWIAIRNVGLFFREGEDFTKIDDPEMNKYLLNISTITNFGEGILIGCDDNKVIWLENGGVKEIVECETKQRISFFWNDGSQCFAISNDGLHALNFTLSKKQASKTILENINISQKIIKGIVRQQNNLWIGMDGGGIDVFDLNTGNLTSYKPNSQNHLTSDAIIQMYKDDKERLWFATNRGGINIYDPLYNQFNVLDNNVKSKMRLNGNFVSAICKDSEGYLWIGTDGSGLSRWNPKTDEVDHFIYGKNCQELGGNNVISVIEDGNGNILVAVYRSGLAVYDKQFNTFRQTDLKNTNIWCMHKDCNDDIWIGTVDSGLFKLEHSTGKISHFDFASNVMSICEANKDQLWLGTANQGLFLFNKSGSISKIFKEFDSKRRIAYKIRDIIVDKDEVWMGIEHVGLVKLLPKEMKFQIYNEKDGICDNSVQSVQMDKEGNFWLGTNNGLSKYDPQNNKAINYYEYDGLPSSQFMISASSADDENLYFGTIGGLVYFQPEKLIEYEGELDLVFTDFKVLNESVYPENSGNIKMDVSIDKVKRITIPYNKSFFSIDYVTPEYSHTKNISYSYILEGLDENWNNVKGLRTANYTNVSPGEYVFKVRAGIDGDWSEESNPLIIKILPPWYLSWWAYLFYLLSFSIVTLVILKYIRERERLKGEINMAEFSRNKEHELNEEKLRFFTNISHEFRTPLTLICGGVEATLNDREEEQVDVPVNTLKLIYNNSKRLLALVNQLISFRKSERIAIHLRVTPFNIVPFVEEIFSAFQLQARQKRMDYKLYCNVQKVAVFIDPEKVDVMIFNLLSNAFKYTPEGGQITLSVATESGQLIIKVIDNGIGILIEDQQKIFERFFRSANQQGVQTGSGIGLALVKHYVSLHHGSIEVESTLNVETTFTIKLPVNEDAYLPSEITNEDMEFHSMHIQMLPSEEQTDSDILGQSLPNFDERKTILIVEDNEELRRFICDHYETHFNVIQAGNGKEGYDKTKSALPDIVISDVMMPEMDGLEFCKLVKENLETSYIPFILLTAKVTEDARNEAMAAGADDYVIKPFNLNYLDLRIKNLFANQVRLQKYFSSQLVLQPSEVKLPSGDKEFLRKVVDLTEDSLYSSDFNVQNMSRKLGMSQSAFYKKIKSLTGMSINEFVRNIRMKRAAQLILAGQHNITEAATEIGYSDMKYFRECFKIQFGKTPSKFIAAHRNKKTN